MHVITFHFSAWTSINLHPLFVLETIIKFSCMNFNLFNATKPSSKGDLQAAYMVG